MKHELFIMLPSEDVRSLCVEKQFYTRGTNEQYAAMLDMCLRSPMDSEKLIEIAEDIVEHTDPDNEWIAPYEAIDEVVCYLLQLCKVRMKLTMEQPDCSVRNHSVSKRI